MSTSAITTTNQTQAIPLTGLTPPATSSSSYSYPLIGRCGLNLQGTLINIGLVLSTAGAALSFIAAAYVAGVVFTAAGAYFFIATSSIQDNSQIEKQGLETLVSRLRAENTTAQAQITILNNQNESLLSRQQPLSERIQQLENDIQGYENERLPREHAMSVLRLQNSAYVQTIDQLNNLNQQMMARITTDQQTIDQLRNENQQLTAQQTTDQQRIEQLNLFVSGSQNSINECQNRIVRLTDELTQERSFVTQRNYRILELIQERDAEKWNVERLTNQINELNTQNRTLNTNLSDQ
jgi:chromosome segregation ATPase